MASGEPVSLASLLEREGPLSTERVLPIMKDAARAVGENHAAGRLHLDLRPSTVFVTPDAQVLLAESALARGIGEAPAGDDEEPGAIPLYYPPEAAHARPLDPRADLFQLGGVFYQALTGKAPFEGRDPVSNALQYIRGEAPAITDSVPGLPVLMSVLVHKLLRREPNERYQSAAEVVEAIERTERLLTRRQAERRTAPTAVQGDSGALGTKVREATSLRRTKTAAGNRKRTQTLVYASAGGAVLILLLAVLLWPRGASRPAARVADKGAEAAVKIEIPVPDAKAATKLPGPRPKTAAPVAPKPEPKKDVKPEPSPPPKSRWAPIEGKGVEKSDDFAKRTEGIELFSVEDYVVAWQYAGPYREEGRQDREGPLDVEFPPEKELHGGAPLPPDQAPKWAPLRLGTEKTRPWLFDFDKMAEFKAEYCAIYVRTRVWSPKGQDVQLWAGSDDSIKVWINARLAHVNKVPRGVKADEDKKEVTLKMGWNDVLVKIGQGMGQCGFCLRFRTLEGQKLEGIKVDPMGK